METGMIFTKIVSGKMLSARIILTGVIFAVLITSAMISAVYSDYISPRMQLEQGVSPKDIQCKEGNVLAIRDNGNPVCVKANTANKLNWDIIATEFASKEIETNQEITTDQGITDQGITTDNVVESQTIILNVASPVEFEDDGREYDVVLQRRPGPTPMYDEIMRADLVIANDDVSGTASITSPPHEKYSKNQGVGLYIDDWMPTYIVPGYKLLYADTDYVEYEKTNQNYHWVKYWFVPNNFVLDSNTTNYTLLYESNGFRFGVSIGSVPHDEIEDRIETLRESRESQSGNYGGFRDMIRDGKTVYAYEGGNDHNAYTATVGFDPDEYTILHVNSNYHTLDELIPVFNSIMK